MLRAVLSAVDRHRARQVIRHRRRGAAAVTGNYGGTSWRELRLAREELDQVLRLRSVPGRAPGGDHRRRRVRGVAGSCPKPDGEHVISRYTLRELLDKLDELTGEHRSQLDSDQD